MRLKPSLSHINSAETDDTGAGEIHMKKTAKGILAAIPLVVGLSGQASAGMSDTADAASMNESSAAIDAALNSFSGTIVGERGSSESDSQNLPSSQRDSSFTSAGSAMGKYLGSGGSERVVSGPGSPVNESYERRSSVAGNASNEPASVTRTADLTTVVRTQGETLAAVATGITPSSSSVSSAPSPQGNAANVKQEPVVVTTPIPAAALLLGSGLVAVAPLRRRKKDALTPA